MKGLLTRILLFWLAWAALGVISGQPDRFLTVESLAVLGGAAFFSWLAEYNRK